LKKKYSGEESYLATLLTKYFYPDVKDCSSNAGGNRSQEESAGAILGDED